MGTPPISTSSHLYPQAIQLKLYQAFIFSIPILFSIILFLLFYLFYLKRRATSFSSSTQILPTFSNPTSSDHMLSVCHQIGLKKEIKDKLPIVLFDEELKTRETLCCVCLAEFEMKEKVLQIPTCKHVFHIECINHWLHTNSTCPLCRSFIIPIKKLENKVQSHEPESPLQQPNANLTTQIIPSEHQQNEQENLNSLVIHNIDESSSTETCPEVSISISAENRRTWSSRESVSLNIQT